MPRCQFDTLRRHQVRKRIVLLVRRHELVHRSHNFFVGVWAGHGENTRVSVTYLVRFNTHATGYDDLAIFIDCFTNGI